MGARPLAFYAHVPIRRRCLSIAQAAAGSRPKRAHRRDWEWVGASKGLGYLMLLANAAPDRLIFCRWIVRGVPDRPAASGRRAAGRAELMPKGACK